MTVFAFVRLINDNIINIQLIQLKLLIPKRTLYCTKYSNINTVTSIRNMFKTQVKLREFDEY